ncbi:ankyrin repeat domain-containing protein [Oceanicola sp. 502str15]|uniref:ankyrin repeat domain-containing protein n=1 Tax=Oceanicola sp. 502str15 TaxID=2696061 RepID=UPI002094659A|nr:ankyrin repeat domain-containing protein [Oceanicola sp. 502str15]MCO6381875.1 hypothetical protein [Oceanicola sp. 502str15]
MSRSGWALGAVLTVAVLGGAGLWGAMRLGAFEIGENMSTIDIEEKGPDGLPIIHWWVEREEFEKIQALLDAGGDIEVPGFQGATPLLKAAVADSWPMAVFLIERGAFVGAVDRRGMTLPWLAATSRVKEGNPDFPALLKVRELLNEKGMLGQYYEPNDVKKRIKEGNWPPK